MDKPTPLCINFGMHIVLTSIFVLQGDGNVATQASGNFALLQLEDQLYSDMVSDLA
jgi:hypothetical protein